MNLDRLYLVLKAESIRTGLSDSLELHFKESHVGRSVLRHLDVRWDLSSSNSLPLRELLIGTERGRPRRVHRVDGVRVLHLHLLISHAGDSGLVGGLEGGVTPGWRYVARQLEACVLAASQPLPVHVGILGVCCHL